MDDKIGELLYRVEMLLSNLLKTTKEPETNTLLQIAKETIVEVQDLRD